VNKDNFWPHLFTKYSLFSKKSKWNKERTAMFFKNAPLP